jgi:hypothetical protein
MGSTSRRGLSMLLLLVVGFGWVTADVLLSGPLVTLDTSSRRGGYAIVVARTHWLSDVIASGAVGAGRSPEGVESDGSPAG